jgi:hypothetical protein
MFNATVIVGFSFSCGSVFFMSFFDAGTASFTKPLSTELSSVFPCLGLYHGNLNPITEESLAQSLATIVFIGFSSIPSGASAGAIK